METLTHCINSGDYYKLYNNEQLSTTQSSKLGVDIKSSVISSVGQADDVIHVANTIDNLRLLVTITEAYCKKYRVKLVPSKTKLLVFTNDENNPEVYLAKLLNPIKIDGVPVKFSAEAEHVGIIRNTSGNLPNLLNRIISHKKSLGAILSAGLARSHRGNPAASLRVHQLYETPVLFSGLAALVLNKAEIGILDSHYLNILQNLQRLHDKTPRAVVLFMAGSLPGEAILHTRQLTLFSMICRLPGDPLHSHAHYVLSCSPRSAKSWFQQVRDICLLYSLPHPLELLHRPPTKSSFKMMVKKNVTEYWENLLRSETLDLTSLVFFNSTQLSLKQPSMLWLAAGSNSFECTKSLIVGKMVSGRYRSDYLCRHWTPTNKKGFCLADTCYEVMGDLAHMLGACPALQSVRERLFKFWMDRSTTTPALHSFITVIVCAPPQALTQFVLDPSQFPAILAIWNNLGQDIINHTYYLTRTFAYYMHREKMIALGRWPGDPGRKAKLITKNRNKPTTINYHDQITNFSVAGSTSAPLAMICTTTTTTTSSPTSVQHRYQRTSVPGCATAICTNMFSRPLALSDHICMGTAGHRANDGQFTNQSEKLDSATLVYYQPDVQHNHGQVCGPESDMRDVVLLCASSQHLTIP